MRALHSFFPSLKVPFIKCLKRLRPSSEPHFAIQPSDTKGYLSAGASGIVYGVDSKRVRKEFYDSEAGEAECRAYERLGRHPHIAELLEVREDGSLIVERGTCLRTIVRDPSANKIPLKTKVKWLKDAAKGHAYLHSLNIIHADVGCHNWILTAEQNVKLIDFEGCSVDGEVERSCYEWFSYSASASGVSEQTDIFAFGCAVYEVLTGRPPHYEYEKTHDLSRQVRELWANGVFPDVMELPLGKLIQGCWNGGVGSMGDIVQELEAFRAKSSQHF